MLGGAFPSDKFDPTALSSHEVLVSVGRSKPSCEVKQRKPGQGPPRERQKKSNLFHIRALHMSKTFCNEC